jgi:transcription-repair coupling factor (superfamily II helicase)
LIERILAALDHHTTPLPLSGLRGTAPVYLISEIIKSTSPHAFVYVTATEQRAQTVLQDFCFLTQGTPVASEISAFPNYDTPPYSNLSPHLDIVADRLKLLSQLILKQDRRLIVTSLPALLSWTLPPSLLKTSLQTLTVGEEIPRDVMTEQLIHWGYQKVPLVEDAGTFAVRGALMDIAPPSSLQPVRIDFFGDTIESIRTFDPTNQKSLDPHNKILISPTRETLMAPELIKKAVRRMNRHCDDKDIPKPKRRLIIDKLKDGIPPAGIEEFLPFYYEEQSTLLDYLPKESHWVLEHPRELKQTWEDLQHDLQDFYAPQKGIYEILDPSRYALPFKEWQSSLHERSQIWIEEFESDHPNTLAISTETNEDIRQTINLTKKDGSLLTPLIHKLQDWSETARIFITVPNQAQAHRLMDLMSDSELSLQICPDTLTHAQSLSVGTIWIVIGELSQGFRISVSGADQGIVIITDEEIFGAKPRRTRTVKKGTDYFSSLSEIKSDDPVVHQDHGIALYRGLKHMTFEGVENDFLLLEFHQGDKLFLPISRINLIQRYVGTEGKIPKLDALGGPRWEKLKRQAEKAIREMAGELINLYAAREAGQGYAFTREDPLFESFEANFPFEETPDQENSIHDVLNDMADPKPMDRLILGDVGYGKTEVALRATFKAVLESKQVAILVPTTLLASQHFERFQERFKNFPVTVEMLSRFRTSAQQKKIMTDMAQGKIDVIIGTHRLLQSDIAFKDLGLLVVDEEHRFGVRHKERIKRFKKSIDVLSMSATPIPRTLYMSLVGVRKISVIETPPVDRVAIRTFVSQFEDNIVREAIQREIKRGGQVFFIHNRVESIENVKQRLQEILPEARIAVGHGQMSEHDLENVMIRFAHREFDILLCTTIVESGIDIPTANTILINRSDRMGLAQIYQLRGRVGRSKQRAYCYLLLPQNEKLTPESKKRIQALQQFSELGTGFRLASHDLEIRGAGNLLGAKQSGQMSALGYELYTELLEKAIQDIKGEVVLDDIDPEINLKISAYIPEDYIPDHSVRLDLYRRLASLREDAEAYQLGDEMEDRFGPRPEFLGYLIELMGLKTLAKRLRLRTLKYDGRKFQMAFDNTTPLDPTFVMDWVKKDPKKYQLTPDMRLTIKAPELKEKERLNEARKVLNTLLQHVS